MMSSQQKQRPRPILLYRRGCQVNIRKELVQSYHKGDEVNRSKELVQSYHTGDDVKSTEAKLYFNPTIQAMMSSQQKQRPCPILPYRR
ncbi:hypothetical protein Bpfe_011958 [Biomphalaria pfeifferi]|uniref:Uncharacterized protein n=2 Tax=Biomphalaria pfeifferi TaxID=112525 RepID=A0AAD8FCC6_BIOPF|nr:hypothetical protein Bpfe_011958 [Biomphalaria pfeifferi]